MRTVAMDMRTMIRAATGGMRPMPSNWNYIQRLLRKVDPDLSGHFNLGILAAHGGSLDEVRRHAENCKCLIERKYGTAEWRDLLRTAAYAPTKSAQERELQ